MKFSLAIILISLFVFASTPAFNQTHYLKIKSIGYKDNSKDLHFPVFYGDSAASLPLKKINQQLQLSELEMLKGFETKNIFEKVDFDNGTIYGGKVDMTYNIYSNNDKLLSLGFNEASSGMTMAYWDRYYNFNTANGDLIQLSDLFTAEGYWRFHKYMVAVSVRNLKKQLGPNAINDGAHWNDVIDDLASMNVDDFYIKGNTLFWDGENCLGKNDKVELDMLVKFKLSEFKPFLNEYGKLIFGLKNGAVAQYKSYSLPQLFTGKIDKYPVLFIIRNIADKEYEAIYCYEKYGRGIYMKGTMLNGKIDMEEMDSSFKNRARVKGKLTGDSIIASWTKAGTTKPLPLLICRK